MKNQEIQRGLRAPIVTVCGHVDHGKTSLLDALRGSSLQELEAGGITQKISFTKYPVKQLNKVCSLLDEQKIKLQIPGFLFIDTPGHAAFTNLRKRGGSLADLAILVVSIKEGIKPQTAEVLQILKAHKTPFFIALNKIDSISGWQTNKDASLKDSIEHQPANVKQEYEEDLLIFQASLQEHGFDSDVYYNVGDFTKKIALVPISAKTKEGISELILVLCGLCQKFLRKQLETSSEAKGVILEIKKDKGFSWAETILYDGILDEGDELVIASFDEPIISKVRAISEIMPLSNKFIPVKSLSAATGARIQLSNPEGILPGMPFQEIKDNSSQAIEKVKAQFKKDIMGSISTDVSGIVAKADSLGSLEALLTLLHQEKISVVRAGIGKISKSDIVAAKANISINQLDAVIVGFNVKLEGDLDVPDDVKVLTDEVVYKLIENLQKWREERQALLHREKMMGLASIFKLEILNKYVFRNSHPAIFGIRVLAGKVKKGISLLDQNGREIGRVKELQLEKSNVEEAREGQELAISVPGVTFDRVLKDARYLYSDIGEKQFKAFKKNKELMSASELRVLEEISQIKRKGKEGWGI